MFECLNDEYFIKLNKLMTKYTVITSKNIGYNVNSVNRLNTDVTDEIQNLFLLVQDYYNKGENPYAKKISKGYYGECYYINYYSYKYLIGKEGKIGGDYIICNIDYDYGKVLKYTRSFIDIVNLKEYYENNIRKLEKRNSLTFL